MPERETAAEEASYLRYAYEFITLEVRRGELHAASHEMMARRVNARLSELGYAPLASTAAELSFQPAPAAPVPVETLPGQPYDEQAPVAATPARAARPKMSGQQLGMTMLLYLGSFFLLAAAITFTAFSWQSFPDMVKFAALAGYTAALFGISRLSDRLGADQPEATFFWLGTATVPVAIGAFCSFVLGLDISPASPGSNGWAAAFLAGNALAAGILSRFRPAAAQVFRLAALALAALAPLAYMVGGNRLWIAVPATTGLLYTAVAGNGKSPEGWRHPAVYAATGTGLLGLFFGAVTAVLGVISQLMTINGGGSMADFAGLGTFFAGLLSLGLSAMTLLVWDRLDWGGFWKGSGYLAGAAGGLFVVLATAMLPVEAKSLAAVSLALVPAAALLAASTLHDRRLFRGAAVPLALASVAFVPVEVWGHVLSPVSFPLALPLEPLVVVGVVAAIAAAAFRSLGLGERGRWLLASAAAALVVPFIAVLLPSAGFPWPAVASALIGLGLVGIACRLDRPESAVPPGLLIAFSLAQAASWNVATSLEPSGRMASVAGLPVGDMALSAVLFAGALALVLVSRTWKPRYPQMLAIPGLAVMAMAAAALLNSLDAWWIPLAVWAVPALAWWVLESDDRYLAAASFAVPFAAMSWGETITVDIPGDNIIMQCVWALPFMLMAVLWLHTTDRSRGVLRSISLVAVPLIVLTAPEQAEPGHALLWFLVVMGGSVAASFLGFSRRWAGPAAVGLLIAVTTVFRFLAPFIAQFPAWMAFALLGFTLVGAYFAWFVLRGRFQGMRERVSEGGWV